MSDIRRIAKLAGVSPATVSRVLNGHPHVAAETRARVAVVIEAFLEQQLSAHGPAKCYSLSCQRCLQSQKVVTEYEILIDPFRRYTGRVQPLIPVNPLSVGVERMNELMLNELLCVFHGPCRKI